MFCAIFMCLTFEELFLFFFYYIKSSFRNKPVLPDEVHCFGGNINWYIMILLLIIIIITIENNNNYRSTVLIKEGFYMIGPTLNYIEIFLIKRYNALLKIKNIFRELCLFRQFIPE